MPTTFAQTIDGNYIYAQRAVQDKNGDDIDQTYAKSASLATVATSGDYTDLSNTPTIPSGSDLVPPYTLPTDEGKVLTVGPSTTYWSTPAAGGVTDVEVDGVSVVSGGVASITMPTVDQVYNSASTHAQSGTAVAGAIATKENVFDVGTGLEMDTSGSTPTLQVEAPVDIVAGPGIAIDNPDGNTLRVSTDENYETVLYDKTDAQGATLASPTINLSETVHNFERIKIYWRTWNTAYSRIVSEFDNPSENMYFDCLGGFYNSTSGVIFALNINKNTAGDTLTFSNGSFFQFTTTSTNPASNTVIYKVVGVHRIAGGN